MEAQAYAEESPYVIRPKKKETKKPNFIARWFFKSLKDAAQAEKDESDIGAISLKERAMLAKESVVRMNDLSTEPMRFSVYYASGGFVVETRTPTRNTKNTIGPDSNTKLHIIHKDADLGQELAKIITLEGLRA